MPSVLSSIFGSGDEGSEGSHNESTATQVEGSGDLTAGQEIGLDAGLTYQDAEGGSHSWQFDNDVGVHTDVETTISAMFASDGYASGTGD